MAGFLSFYLLFTSKLKKKHLNDNVKIYLKRCASITGRRRARLRLRWPLMEAERGRLSFNYFYLKIKKISQ